MRGTVIERREYKGEVFVRLLLPSGVETDWIPASEVNERPVYRA